jgi:lipoprotein-anchoring transpeptidase ErfK/SrfK
MRHARRSGALAVGVLGLALAGCSGGGTPAPGGSSPAGSRLSASGPGATSTAPAGRSTAPVAVAAPARLAVSPANGARGVSPASPVRVSAASGRLTSVTVTNADGKRVAGALGAGGGTWRSTEDLGYDRAYSVTALAVGSNGATARITSSFRTVRPVTFTMPSLFPAGQRTVGVGQPVTVHFDEAITDRAAAERALSVTTSPHVDGGWYWFDSQNVHWRPRAYWPAGARVTVRADVYGVNVGGGIYGQQDAATSFRIGPARITTVDDRTHEAVVRVDGRIVRRMPVSMGKGGCQRVGSGSVCFTTHSGPHVVQEKYPVKIMSSASFGLPVDAPGGYSTRVELATRISADGEFLHSAPWSVAQQGHTNVSHGCVNLSPDNARWFYDTMTYGDVVDIRNTGLPLPPDDKYGDWMVPWPRWLAGSALR